MLKCPPSTTIKLRSVSFFLHLEVQMGKSERVAEQKTKTKKSLFGPSQDTVAHSIINNTRWKSHQPWYVVEKLMEQRD